MYILSDKLAHFCGSLSPKEPKIHFFSYKLALFCGSTVKITLYDVVEFNRQGQNCTFFSDKLEIFCGKVKRKLYLRDGISPERAIMTFPVTKWNFLWLWSDD